MAGQALAASSSQAWSAMGSQAETAISAGWILDQSISGAGAFATLAAPSTATAFLSSGDGTSGSGNGFYSYGRPVKVVHTGGTAYALVLNSSYTAPVTTINLEKFLGGTTSLSTVAITSAAVAPVWSYGDAGNLRSPDINFDRLMTTWGL